MNDNYPTRLILDYFVDNGLIGEYSEYPESPNDTEKYYRVGWESNKEVCEELGEWDEPDMPILNEGWMIDADWEYLIHKNPPPGVKPEVVIDWEWLYHATHAKITSLQTPVEVYMTGMNESSIMRELTEFMKTLKSSKPGELTDEKRAKMTKNKEMINELLDELIKQDWKK